MSKKTYISEDNQMLYNKWVAGIAKGDAPADVVTVDDIVNRFRNDLSGRAPKILPFPLSLLLDFIGNIFIKTAELRHTLVDSLHYPVIKDSEKKVAAVKSLNKKMKEIQDILYTCTEQLNILVENEKDKDKIKK